MTSIPKTTHAVQFFKNGGPEVLEFHEVEVATPQPDELLIKVEWAGVNFIDTYFRRGIYETPKFPFTVGQELAGTVVTVPTDPGVLESQEYKLSGITLGSKVMGYVSGAMIGYTAVKWNEVAPAPPTIGTRLAAASFVSGLTALSALRESYPVQKGDWILVHAAAGGLGLQLVQIAKRFGANVIGTTSTPEKSAIATAHGADHVILYTKENVVDRVLEITNGQGVNAIYDGVGKDTWEDDFKSIARKGTIVSLGNSSGVVPPFAPLKLTPKNLKVVRPTLMNYIATPEELYSYSKEYLALIADGVKVPIHQEYPFSAEGVAQAQIDLTGRGTSGKLLVKIAD